MGTKSLVLNRRPKVPAEDTAAFGAIAERFRRAGALDQAVSLCRDGLQKFPDHISARATLGWSLLDLGKYDEARIELEQVLRRAPDNLAAIRGLAELHDRFEHTLHLPMDGPGQWPPPPDAVGDEDTAHVAAVSEDARVDEDEYEVVAEPEPMPAPVAASADPSPTMAPADVGLPLWTPSVEEPAAPAAAASVAATGMSSIRDLDPFAGAASPAAAQAAPETPHAIMPVVTDQFAAADPTIVALIAEADTLEAAAEGEIAALAEVPAEIRAIEIEEVEEDQAIELGRLEAAAEEGDFTAPVAAFEAEPAVAIELSATEAMAELDQVSTEFATTSAAEPDSVAPEPPSAVAAVQETLVADAAVEVALGEAASVDDIVDLAPAAFGAFEHPAAVLAFAPVPEPAPTRPFATATLAALERMLGRVQVRRSQLMAESVA